MSARVLVVDDDAEMAEVIAEHLASRGYVAEAAVGGKAAIAALKKRAFDAVITDLRMDGVDGFDVLAASRKTDPERPVLLMTAYGTVANAVEAVQQGAYHYLTKPFKLAEACVHLERALAERRLQRENAELRRAVEERAGFGDLVGKSAVMRQLYDLVDRVGPSTAPVLVLGETGTGKELVARALHHAGARGGSGSRGPGEGRGAGPFVAVNCAAMPEALLESELFGHTRGAFTGAHAPRRGLYAEADGGTLFLDEIGELAPALQAKLLRVLETSSFRPVGGGVERKVDVRLVAATNLDLLGAVRDKRFREDLYYRLMVIPVHVPPLRSRREDIPLLVEHFVRRYHARHPDQPEHAFTADALRRLMDAPWPGNVRELENAVERLLLLARGKHIDARDVAAVLPESLPSAVASFAAEIVPMRVLQRRYVEWVLVQTGGNKLRTAQLLGIDASTIYRMLARDDGGEP